jgi:hypothetical protein
VMANLAVIEQPSEMGFYVKQLAQQGKLRWGRALDLLRIGVMHDTRRSRNGKRAEITVFLENLGTNADRNLRLPPVEEQFDISLVDATGAEVSKTALGRRRGLPLNIPNASSGGAEDLTRTLRALLGFDTPRRRRGFRPVLLSAGDAAEIGRFDLGELFVLEPPGTYRLTFTQRFYRLGLTNSLSGVTMPSVSLPLDIR